MQHFATEVQMDVYWCQNQFLRNVLFQSIDSNQQYHRTKTEEKDLTKKKMKKKNSIPLSASLLRYAKNLLTYTYTYFSQCAKQMMMNVNHKAS